MNKQTEKSKPIRVLHVVGRMDRGGTEALLMNLLRTIDRNTIIFDFIEQTPDPCDYDQEILDLGGKIYRCPTIGPGRIVKYVLWWIDFLKNHPEYYIVHGHSRGSGPFYLTIARMMGRKTIIHCHSNSYGTGIRAFGRFLWQFPLHFVPEYYFACSKDAGYSQYGRHKKFKVILNGIETEKYHFDPLKRNAIREELAISKDCALIGYVARLEHVKNHTYLLDVFKALKEKEFSAKLIFVGQGSLKNELEEKARKLSIYDDVLFAGLRTDVNELLQAMDIFVMPSLYEGLPLVLVEAQAAGLPCVVSDTALSEEIIITDNIVGLSLEDGPGRWAEVVEEQLRNTSVRGDTTAQIVSAGFDIRTTRDYLTGFYQSLYNER